MFRFLILFFLVFSSSYCLASQPDQLTFVFQKQKDPIKVKQEADLLAAELAKGLNLEVKTQVPTDYASAVQALVSNKADIAYLDSVSYLLAKRDANAEILLAEVRPDSQGKPRTDYDSLILVPKNSPLKSIEDLMQQAKNLHFVFVSPTSTSGYIMPYRRFVNEGLIKPGSSVKDYFKKVNFAGSYALAMQQVANGQGDACAVSYYAFESDSANKYLSASEKANLRILARTSGVPTHVIAINSEIGSDLKQNIKKTLLEIGTKNPDLLSDIYGTANFTNVDSEKHVAATQEALTHLGLPIDQFIKK